MNEEVALAQQRSETSTLRDEEGDGLSLRRRTWLQIAIVTAVFGMICLFRILALGKELDRAGDAYSEANSIRAADAYLSEGFTSHHGLQRIVYGERFPDVGAIKDVRFFGGAIPEDRNSFVYTHYPPGPDYVIAVAALVTGLDNLALLRAVPAAVTALSLLVLMVTISRAFGRQIFGPLTGIVLIAAPLFCRYAVVMHLQAYTTAGLLLATAICVDAFWIAGVVGRRHLLLFALLGFLQGWMSFDYCFVAVFAAVPVWLLARSVKQISWSGLLQVVVVSGLAFSFAHLLHFLQVVGELGGIEGAIAELGGAAKYRAGIEPVANSEIAHQPYPSFVLSAIWSHLHLMFDGFKDASRRETFSFSMIGMLLAWVVVQLGAVRMIGRGYHLMALASAMMIGIAWSVAMPQHAKVHAAFTIRHFLLLYLAAWLSLVICVSGRTARPAMADGLVSGVGA